MNDDNTPAPKIKYTQETVGKIFRPQEDNLHLERYRIFFITTFELKQFKIEERHRKLWWFDKKIFALAYTPPPDLTTSRERPQSFPAH